MTDQQTIDALANLRELREREVDVLFVNCHTGPCLDDVWVVLDYVAALEAIADAAGEFVEAAYLQDLTKPIVMPGEFDTLEDALKAVGK